MAMPQLFVKGLCAAALAAGGMAWLTAAGAAQPKAAATADSTAARKPETEIDISGPYNAHIDGEDFPSTVDIWGPKATLKIAMDGQDKPMLGMFVKEDLKVVFKYGAENFNLTTMVEARYDGQNFVGQYSRADEKLGVKNARIVLTPFWHGGGGAGVKMPLPRRLGDVEGNYGLALTKDGKTITDRASFKVDDGTLKLSTGGRLYQCDFSDKEIAPVFWEGNRMDTFRLVPTESGFKGVLVKEISNRQEVFDVVMNKGRGGGGDGHDRDWTYVYDVIFSNTPPVWIGKLTMHEDEARLVIELKDGLANMKGSLVDNVLSATGDYGRSDVSIRAQKTPYGFAGAFRRGAGALVQELPVVLKNRPARAAGPGW